MKDLWSICLIYLLLILMTSCNLDELNFEEAFKGPLIHPEIVAPVAKGNITVWDLVNAANNENNTNLSTDSTGLIKIIYKQNDLFTYKVKDLYEFPEAKTFSSKDQVLGDIFLNNINIAKAITLNELSAQMNGVMDGIIPFNGKTVTFPTLSAPDMNAKYALRQVSEFNTATISQGTLSVKLENKLKVPITIEGSLFDNANNRAVSTFTFTSVAPGATKTSSYNMAGAELSNKLEFRLLSFKTPGSLTPVNLNMEDYFNINFDFTNLGLSEGNLNIVNALSLEGSRDNFEFDFPESDLKAFGAVLNKGSITVKTVNNLPMTGTVNLILSEIKDKATGLPVTASVPLNGTPKVISIDNTVINFSSDPSMPYNRIPYTYTLTINQSAGYINYSHNDAIQLEVTLDKLEFQSVSGDFGKRILEVDPGKFDLDVDLLDKIEGEFKLANPSLVLTMRNSMGIPSSMSLGLVAHNKAGNSVSLNIPAFDLPVPADIHAGAVSKNVTANKQNSNIVDFIALPPSGEVSYSGKVEFNPTNTVTAQNANFMDIDAAFGVDMAIELPMELQISKLGFKDTTAINGSNYQKVETAELILNARNGIPLDIDMQLLFVDTITGQQVGATKISRILSAAQVNANSQITPVQSSHSFLLDKTEMEKLRKANAIVFSGLVSSPDSGTAIAPFFSESQIELSVVIKAKANF